MDTKRLEQSAEDNARKIAKEMAKRFSQGSPNQMAYALLCLHRFNEVLLELSHTGKDIDALSFEEMMDAQGMAIQGLTEIYTHGRGIVTASNYSKK
jgi:hypothetical protein